MTESLKLTEPLARLIARLESNQGMTNSRMLELLAEADIKPGDIEPYSYFDHPAGESYGRRGIYLSGSLRVFALSWNRGDFTAIHDHEPAEWGAVQFFGDLSHRLYTIEGGQVILTQSNVFTPGMMVAVSGNLIHSMGNLSADRAMTLHIYGTNSFYEGDIKTRVFDLEKNQVVLTGGAAFLNRKEAESRLLPDRIHAEPSTYEDYLRNTALWRNRYAEKDG